MSYDGNSALHQKHHAVRLLSTLIKYDQSIYTVTSCSGVKRCFLFEGWTEHQINMKFPNNIQLRKLTTLNIKSSTGEQLGYFLNFS